MMRITRESFRLRRNKVLISFLKGSPPQLTTLGRTMSLFPLDPRFTKVILASVEHRCLEEALTVIALLSGESIFMDPPTKREQAHNARSRYGSCLHNLFIA